ncbi:MAG: hypothetical protein Q9163_002359 [Psora crenata]
MAVINARGEESRPQCSNCLKHEIECDFLTNQPDPKASPKAKRQRTQSYDIKSVLRGSVGQVSPAPRDNPNGSGSRLQPLQMDDLELLHHFTTETCYTLSDRAESHELWRVTVPQLAFHHDFLMRGILAISALHLSHLRPAMHEHFTHIGAQQQDAALRSFRPIMVGMDSTNCDASFAMSSLIVVYGFESPKLSDSLGMFSSHGEHSDEWLPLIRGVNSILQSLWPSVKCGRLSRLLHDEDRHFRHTQLPKVLENQLSNLEQFCENMTGDGIDDAACKDALGQLRRCFERMNDKSPYECEVSLAFVWPVMIPPHFISMLNKRDPKALIILAHYCLILHHLDGYWWMRGWARHILDNIRPELDDSWQNWLRWPSEVVNVDEKVLTNGLLQNPVQETRVNSDFNTAATRTQLSTPKVEQCKSSLCD